MNNFEFVSGYENCGLTLPCRKTAHSAGYDFMVAEDTIVYPYSVLMDDLKAATADNNKPYTLDELADITKHFQSRPTLVPTGVKCQLDDDKYLELSVRSSSPLKYWLVLANGVGIIDSDYYNNSDNEGHIYFQIINLGPRPVVIKKGEYIGQGIIKSYGVADNDISSAAVRAGGFGSTGGTK